MERGERRGADQQLHAAPQPRVRQADPAGPARLRPAEARADLHGRKPDAPRRRARHLHELYEPGAGGADERPRLHAQPAADVLPYGAGVAAVAAAARVPGPAPPLGGRRARVFPAAPEPDRPDLRMTWAGPRRLHPAGAGPAGGMRRRRRRTVGIAAAFGGPLCTSRNLTFECGTRKRIRCGWRITRATWCGSKRAAPSTSARAGDRTRSSRRTDGCWW